ncbi:hypothetical protein JCM11251_005759 [Rhodosporidiobolus azoricus]
MFARLFQTAPTSKTAEGASSPLAVIILGEEDQFDTSYVEQGQSGGRSAARKLHKVMEGEVEEGTSILAFYVDDLRARHIEEAAFFDGFCSSTSKMTLVVPPGTGAGGTVERIAQLISFFLPFPFVSKVFLGHTSSDTLFDNLESLTEEQRGKSTVLHGGLKRHNRLVEEGGFRVLKIEAGLFGEKMEKEHRKSVSVASSKGSKGEALETSRINGPDSYRPRHCFIPTADFPAPAPIPFGPFEAPRLFFGGERKPCRDFCLYKYGCRKGDRCHYSHNYPFSREDWLAFPRHIASLICPQMRDHGACSCPHTAETRPFGRQCNFRLAGLPHSVEKDADEVKEERTQKDDAGGTAEKNEAGGENVSDGDGRGEW